MSASKFQKRFSRAGSRYGLLFTMWMMRKLPFGMIKGMMHFFIFLWYRGAGNLRRVADESLSIAFGEELDKQSRARIVRECFNNIGRSMIDLIFYAEYPEQIKGKCAIEAKERLDAALQPGRGVIIVTAHFGNFCLMMLELAQAGYKVNCILRRPRDPVIGETIYNFMTRCGVRPIYSIPARRSVQESLKALRNNEILCILLDQHFGSEGSVMVDFFGRKAATATGPVIMAQRTNAAILPVFTIRDGDRYRIIIEPPLNMETEGTDQEKLTANVAGITRIIESYIRRYPAEWGWMHRRWKNSENERPKPA